MDISSYENYTPEALQRFFAQVFGDSEGPEEGELVGQLSAEMMTTTPADSIDGFVATEGKELVGAILFSRMYFDEPVEAFILAPVSVRTDQQGKGVGQALIRFGLDQMAQKGVKLMFTYGDPAYYSQVGFQPIKETLIQAPLPMSLPHGWQCQTLDGSALQPMSGRPRSVKALHKPEYW